MFRSFKDIAAFTNVNAGQRATVDFPVDRRYYGIHIEFREDGTLANRAALEEKILRIEVNLNGVTQWDVSAKQLFAILDHHGQQFHSGIVPLHFAEPWRRTPDGEDQMAWALAGNGIANFQVHIELKEGVTNPTLKAFAEYDRPQPVPLGFIRKYTRQQVSPAATGLETLNSIPAIGNLQSLYAFEAQAGDIREIKLERDSNVVYAATREMTNHMNELQGGSTVADVFAVRLDRTERGGASLLNQVRSGNATRRVPVRLDLDMVHARPVQLVYSFVGSRNG